MKIVITGGHITPALAVIESLPEGTEIVFIGRKHTFESDTSLSFEYEEITRRGIPFRTLPSARLQRSMSRHTIPSLFRLPRSVALARTLLKEIRPDVVLSFGGYIGLPVVTAARSLSIPAVIHEQTTRAGFANKFSARFAKRVCISWESSRVFFHETKTLLTGNPLRREVLNMTPSARVSKTIPRLYITGGSGGSHFLNVLVEKHLVELLEIAEVTHQTGNAGEFLDFQRLKKHRETLPEKLKKRYHLKDFLFSKEASETIANADLVIGRSGINTICELIYFQKPALCIPLPTGQRGEQHENAVLLTSLGLGRILSQTNADELFVSQVREMLESLLSFSLSDQSLRPRFVQAADKIVGVLNDVADKTSNKKT